MSRTLIIARHAKSSWTNKNTADIDRPLAKRGYRDAQLMGTWLNTYCTDNRIREIRQLESPASRAQLTSRLLSEALTGVVLARETIDALYLASMHTLIDVIQQQSDDESCLLLVGHNPGLHSLVELYSGEYLNKFPTCAIACFQFDSQSWSAASKDTCVGFTYMKPKKLRVE